MYSKKQRVRVTMTPAPSRRPLDLPSFRLPRLGLTPLALSTLSLQLLLLLLVEILCADAQVIYPDGGRNVIKLKAKPTRIIPYNDGSVMANVIGSAGMNFQYYFHILGVSCENNEPEFYKTIQMDFEYCLNKIGPLPRELRDQPLGSVRKPCYDWELHRKCYKNLASDYDECLAGRPGLLKKGTDAMRFTHAYYKFVCGNIADTKAHLLDRFYKHDLLVPGVFQCFPELQDRINNCVKRDKISKTLCSKFFIVHACFGKYYNDDNCADAQPIYYMDDLFRNMSATLNCGKDDTWNPIPNPNPLPPPGGDKGWSSREEYGWKENPFPGEMGRPWSSEKGRIPGPVTGGPYVRGGGGAGNGWTNKERVQIQVQNPNRHHHQGHHHSYDRQQQDPDSGEGGRGRDRLVDPHANRPYPDNWNKPWIDILDRGSGPSGPSQSPWGGGGKGRNPNSIDSTRGTGRGSVTYVTRPSPTRGYYPPVQGPNSYQKPNKVLPPAGYAITRVPQEQTEGDQGGVGMKGRGRFYSTRESDDPFPTEEAKGDDGDDENGYNFFSFE